MVDFLAILESNPEDLSVSSRMGLYSAKCRVCNSEWRQLIDTLLLYFSSRVIAKYVNGHELFSPPISHQSIHNHKKRHIYQ